MAEFVGTFAAKEGKLDDVWITGSKDMWLRSNQGYKSFESRKSILCDILDWLTSPNVNMIGVYGIGGVGKTALMHEVLFEAKKQNLFDQVIFVLASSTANVKRIQDEIADQLCLELCKGTESERARTLFDRLWKENKILVILDDICTSIDLVTVGIPFGNAHRGCKILLASRYRDILVSEMHSQYNYCVSVLNKEEAWSLFKKMVGDYVEDSDLESIAIQVANECGGLPLAIVIVARALRNKPLSEWKGALLKLRSSAGKLDALVYSSIELSYNYLIDQVLKSAFLLCGLLKHPYDASVMDLLKHGMGLGLFEGIYTMQERRDRVYALVHILKDSCLLLDGRTEDWFSMHDIVRNVAISIASRDHHVIRVRNDILVEWLNNDILKNCSAVFLNDIKTGVLPEGLEYPQLDFFCMNSKDPFFKMPENFFTGMSKLRGLALSEMQLLSLPPSVHLLSNLQTLCLDQCVVGDISIIGNLKKLEILSLVDSDIERLPNEIGQLTQLRCLDLSFCRNLKVIPPNVISKLTQLEELYMGNTSVKWEFEGLNIERSNASLQELRHLSQLTTLEIQIQDAMILPKGLFSKKLERYKIYIGDEWDWSGKSDNTRALKLKLCSSIYLDEILMQLKGIEHLYLDEVPGIKNVLYDLEREGFPQLKHLQVQNNPFILCITDSTAWVCFDAFPLLESLVLHNLIHMEKICHSQLTAVSFCNLKIIKVRNCDRLKNVFSFSIARGLPQLQTITVIKCKNVEEIFMMERDGYVDCKEVNKIEFSQLRSLTLKFLPRLRSFYFQMEASATAKETHRELTTHRWTNKVILKDEFDTPIPLFNEMVVFPNLETLELCAVGTEKIWCNQSATVSCIQNLTCLIVHGCDKLKYLFPSSMVRNFVQLKHLEICYCTALEEIVGKEGGAEASATFVFPKVVFLKLWNLSELRTFYSGMHTSEWPLLKRLEVYGCDKVKIFTSGFFGFQSNVAGQLIIPAQQSLFLVEKVIANLEELKLSGKDITMICHDHLPKHLFQNLKSLEIVSDKSDNFSIGFLQRFHNVERLKLRNSSYKEIFSNGEVEKQAGMLTQIKSLKLWELSNLLHIWEQCYKLDSVFQNLETLEIWWCNNLINLVPSSASFENLTTLEVSYCQRLKNLVSSSTAKSLVCLMKLRIDGCKLMTEIISSEGDVEEDEIVFSRLKWLSLECLDSLTSFCSGNCTFKFPSLEDLFVIDCPKMMIFSFGVLSTPRLREVRKNWGLDKGCWEGNLNTTIQKLCNNKVMLPPGVVFNPTEEDTV
ncbi:probable disease resistance protein At4g27220 isoform X2 [Citrus sinensis]|uniref:probable disease resistance protein At4g27220 isoform X2 n=1 Tax=Citrus sinensis TaxID=2711 RepID=UPI002277D608|nr:probable disease resistance protein At4g27220 isoform X2 [Citrus sinensis]